MIRGIWSKAGIPVRQKGRGLFRGEAIDGEQDVFYAVARRVARFVSCVLEPAGRAGVVIFRYVHIFLMVGCGQAAGVGDV